MKRTARMVTALIVIASVVAAFAGCAAKKDDNAGSASQDYKSAAYIALRITENKVNTVFAKDTAADGTPIMTASVGTADDAKQLLSGYMQPDVVDAVMQHYLTDKKVDGATVVNAEPFFNPSILETTQADVTIAGTQDDVTVTTKDNTVYEMKKVDNKYVLASIKK